MLVFKMLLFRRQDEILLQGREEKARKEGIE